MSRRLDVINLADFPGAFVVEAQDFNSFGQAIISKLIAEIAFAPRPNDLPRG